jgi:hypothetical protein
MAKNNKEVAMLYISNNLKSCCFRVDVSVDLGSGPDAGRLDAEVVFVHLDAEEAVLAPVRAPAVAADPVLASGKQPVSTHFSFGSLCNDEFTCQICQIFLGTIYPNGKKLPNDHKICIPNGH